MAVVFFLDIYYCIIIAWTFFYLIATFTALPDLPWNTCGKQSIAKRMEDRYRTGSRFSQIYPGTPAVSRACQRVSKRGTGQVTVIPDLPWNTCHKQSMSKSIADGYTTVRLLLPFLKEGGCCLCTHNNCCLHCYTYTVALSSQDSTPPPHDLSAKVADKHAQTQPNKHKTSCLFRTTIAFARKKRGVGEGGMSSSYASVLLYFMCT
jgi:hypothetical protein